MPLIKEVGTIIKSIKDFKGESLVHFVGLDLILHNAMGLTADGSPDSFPNCNFRVLVICSTFLEL
jgi:hypothetical protein